MRLSKSLLALAILSIGSMALAASDSLGQMSFKMQASNPDAVLTATLGNLKAVFNYYQPAFDSGTQVISPLEVSGTQNSPVLDLAVKKCVFVECQTVEMYAELSLQNLQGGNCKRHFVVSADLSRSSEILSDMYSKLQVDVCYNSNAGNSTIEVNGSAVRSQYYSGGIVAQQIMDMLQMQIQPMAEALEEALHANGGTVTEN